MTFYYYYLYKRLSLLTTRDGVHLIFISVEIMLDSILTHERYFYIDVVFRGSGWGLTKVCATIGSGKVLL